MSGHESLVAVAGAGRVVWAGDGGKAPDVHVVGRVNKDTRLGCSTGRRPTIPAHTHWPALYPLFLSAE